MKKGIKYFFLGFAVLYFAASVWQKITPKEPSMFDSEGVVTAITDKTEDEVANTKENIKNGTVRQKIEATGERIGDFFADLFSGISEGSNTDSDASKMQNDAITGIYEEAKLIRVVDGDTLIVQQNGQEIKVRMIGIDTPESVAPEEYLEKTGKENTEAGFSASDYTKELLSGVEKLYLESDEADQDIYGRYLRYVWLSVPEDDSIDTVATYMVNGILLRDKIAKPLPVVPNIKYERTFSDIYDTYSN